MLTAKEILDLINHHLDHLPYTREPQSLYEPIRYVLSMGGKRIRPSLMLMGYNLYKEDPESILPQACALETYHNYTLLHDDLMDRADMRRGHLTVHKKWNDNAAILSGDSMLVLAFQRMAQCDERHLRPVLDLFTETSLQIGEGQQYDIDFETRTDVTEDEYIEMIRLKTSVLLACALKIGAIMADAPQADADALYTFGERMGLAFQLQDDYLDVYGNPEIFGKAIGGDILCNKKTYMLIQALRRAEGSTLADLQRWLDAEQPNPEEKIAAVTYIYKVTGVKQLCEEQIERYTRLGLESLSRVALPESTKQPLCDLMQGLINRQS